MTAPETPESVVLTEDEITQLAKKLRAEKRRAMIQKIVRNGVIVVAATALGAAVVKLSSADQDHELETADNVEQTDQ